MTLRFATAEARLNQAVFARLCNAEVMLDGVPMSGIFDLTPAVSFDTVGGELPRIVVPMAQVPADPRGMSLVNGAATYTVRDFFPDGHGGVSLHLEAV